jgi:hypothetical protein
MFDISAPIRSWLSTVIYPGFQPGLPDLIVGTLPRELAAALGRQHKIWIVETVHEMRALDAALARPIPIGLGGALDFKSGPDAACSKTSSGESFAALYLPPETGQPYIALYAWPNAIARDVRAQRNRYTYDTFGAEDAALDALARIGVKLGVKVRYVPAQQ